MFCIEVMAVASAFQLPYFRARPMKQRYISRFRKVLVCFCTQESVEVFEELRLTRCGFLAGH
jgi:hypothetical protein